MSEHTEAGEQERVEANANAQRKREVLASLSRAYAQKLENDMGTLHNQMVGFISSSGVPLPQALLVIEMIRKEIVDQAYTRYLES